MNLPLSSQSKFALGDTSTRDSSASTRSFVTLLRAWLVLLSFFISACQPSSSTPSATLSPDPVSLLVSKAETARVADNREAEALALREAIEKLAATSPNPPQLVELRKRCVSAMVEAGGNASSFELWSRIAKERPAEAEAAKRMVKRAREMMTQQGTELLAQVDIDEKAGQRQSALCSALAAKELFTRVSADPKEQALAQKHVSRLSKELKI